MITHSIHRDSNANPAKLRQRMPLCPICNKAVPLDTAKTEEHGLAIHEQCYLLKLQRTTEGSAVELVQNGRQVRTSGFVV